jgi:hypothetical protein
MGYTTASDIIDLRNPNLSAAQVGQKSDMIALATSKLEETVYGDFYQEAIALLALHMFAIQDRGGSGGPVTSEREGGLARSFAASASSSDWASTSWGLELMTLTRSVSFGPRTRVLP